MFYILILQIQIILLNFDKLNVIRSLYLNII